MTNAQRDPNGSAHESRTFEMNRREFIGMGASTMLAGITLGARAFAAEEGRITQSAVTRATKVPMAEAVDLLIPGGGSAAVALAERAAAQGLRVLVLEARPFLGEDRCAVFDFQDKRPNVIKMDLEERLIAAGVRFRFGSYLIDLLVDAGGRVGGALIGSVSGWQVQLCRLLVDASDEAVALALLDPRLRRRGSRTVALRSMAPQAPAADAVRLASLRWLQQEVQVWSRQLEVDCGDGSVPARAAAEVRARLEGFRPEQQRMADRLAYAPIAAGRNRPGICRVDAVDLGALPPALPLTDLRQLTQGDGIQPGEQVRPTAIHPRFAALPTHTLDVSRLPVLATVDVLVIGAGTAGAPAGIAAARLGAQTLVCEQMPNCGGLGTEGLISNYWFGNRDGFTKEIDNGVAAIGQGKNTRGWNPEHKMYWYLRRLHQAGAAVWFGSSCLGAIIEGNRVRGAVIGTPWGCGLVRARSCVDATGSAELPAAAGAPCRIVGAPHVSTQSVGLGPRDPEEHYRNNGYTFIDVTDSADITQAHVVARRRFPNAFDCVQIVQSRERRQIAGVVEVSPIDLFAERTWPDTILSAISNVDCHGFTIHTATLMNEPSGKQLFTVHVPFRSMLPQDLDGVLVAGIGTSLHHDVRSVVRMQPDMQNQGYAAGYAAALAARKDGSFHRLDLRPLQEHLVKIGNLDAKIRSFQDSFPITDDRIATAIAGPLDNLADTAVLLAEPARTLPGLRKAYAAAQDEQRRLRLGEFLLACGDAVAAEAVKNGCQAWDKGADFRGRSFSPVEIRLVLLARCRAPGTTELLRLRLAELKVSSPFSTCRAMAVALQCLPDPTAAEPLATLLKKPGMSGHHCHELRPAQIEKIIPEGYLYSQIDLFAWGKDERNKVLKELHLARALVACGDHQGIGRRILECYADDLRGYYARHARALLAEGCARTDAI